MTGKDLKKDKRLKINKEYDGSVKDIDSMLSFLDAMAKIISEMFGENCEVIISDLDNPKSSVVSIYNGHVTGRSIGDPLSVRAEELISRSIDGYNINYRKANKKIKKEIKSSTIVSNIFGKNISFCINYDCDEFTKLHNKLGKFLYMQEEMYDEIEYYDNKELVEQIFSTELEKTGKTIVSMKKNDRIELIKNLKSAGVFNLQKSVPYIAERLGVSRFTIYNYLNYLEEAEK